MRASEFVLRMVRNGFRDIFKKKISDPHLMDNPPFGKNWARFRRNEVSLDYGKNIEQMVRRKSEKMKSLKVDALREWITNSQNGSELLKISKLDCL